MLLGGLPASGHEPRPVPELEAPAPEWKTAGRDGVQGVMQLRLVHPPEVASSAMLVFGVVGLLGNVISLAVLSAVRFWLGTGQDDLGTGSQLAPGLSRVCSSG